LLGKIIINNKCNIFDFVLHLEKYRLQYSMSLIVPSEYKKDISKHSGYLKHGSAFAKKSLKGLFRAPENVHYIANELYALVTHPQFVHDHLDVLSYESAFAESDNFVANGVKTALTRPTLRGVPTRKKHTKPSDRALRVVKGFKNKKNLFVNAIPQMMEEYVLPYPEDQNTKNPIMLLHYTNRDFLLTSGQMMVQNPDVLDGSYRTWNPDTGETENPADNEYQFSSESWNDGTWHPEHLFTQSEQNRNNPYWKPLRVEFWNGPIGYPQDADGIGSDGGRGPGNRYKHIAEPNLEMLSADPDADARRGDDRGIYAGASDIVSRRNARFSNGGQFPFWQTTVHHRPYETDNSETLSEGGLSDRRTQRPHGYRMENLTRKSGARKEDIPRQTHFDN
jgi:hypothetical protein